MKFVKTFYECVDKKGYRTLDDDHLWICRESVKLSLGKAPTKIVISLSTYKIPKSIKIEIKKIFNYDNDPEHAWALLSRFFHFTYVDATLSDWLEYNVGSGNYYLSMIDGDNYGIKPNGQKYWNVRKNGQFTRKI